MIYIYSKKPKEVIIKLTQPDVVTESYPEYDDGWIVDVLNDSYNILEKTSNKKLSALHYDTILVEIPRDFITYGYNVPRDNILEFLDKKLKFLGLNHYERNQFIVSWIRVLMKNDYTHVYFEINPEVVSRIATGLEITPKPSNLAQIRILFEACNSDDVYKKQELHRIKRDGLSVVDLNAYAVNIRGIQR